MSDPTQKKLEAKSVGYKIGVAESERSLSNLGLGNRRLTQLLFEQGQEPHPHRR
jgi:hypothetical protein